MRELVLVSAVVWGGSVGCGGPSSNTSPSKADSEDSSGSSVDTDDSVDSADSIDSADSGEDEPLPPPDPVEGRRALLNENYIGCGIPASIYEEYYGSAGAWSLMPEREGRNAELPFYMTAFESDTGVEVITSNCLYCHATDLEGEVVIGLGDSRLNFTDDPTLYAAAVPLLAETDAEREEAQLWSDRMVATSKYVVTDTTGVNPADTIAATLFAHRDADTLAWHADPLLEMPDRVVPTDVPPLWNLRKKTRTLYTGAGQGNITRIMMTASALCVDDTERADEIYLMFRHIHAYLDTIEPPVWPGTLDSEAVARGKEVFDASCATCHGIHGDDWTYPELVVSTDEVGTDPLLSDYTLGEGLRFVEWFERSWYGQDASIAGTGGYIAPPLDGIWATAPYFHNGSVPTLEGVVDSSKRPTYWRRASGYDSLAPGLNYSEDTVGKADTTGNPATLYDTTLEGYSNAGHPYGDGLSADERADLMVYLRSL